MIWMALIAGIFIGATSKVIWGAVYDPNPHRAPRAMLPPSTARQIRRDRRATRADLSHLGRAGIPSARTSFDQEPP